MKNLVIIALVCLMNITTNAQERWIMSSGYLEQPDTVLIFKPSTYNRTREYPVVYLLHGYSENYRQWPKTADLQQLADQYNFIIVAPDGFTFYYINSPIDKAARYEDFFFKELAPKVQRSFKVDKKNIFISGLSMGGYGALRYFILHPDYFNTAGAASGALEIDYPNFQRVSQQFWQSDRMVDDLTKIIGNPDSTDWRQYSISTLLRQHPGFRKPFIFDCGTADVLYPLSAQLKQQADSLKIPTTFISRPGDHNTAYWRVSIEYHFIYFRQSLKE